MAESALSLSDVVGNRIGGGYPILLAANFRLFISRSCR